MIIQYFKKCIADGVQRIFGHCIQRKQTSHTGSDELFTALTPVDNADEKGVYSKAIEWALKHPDIKNIAITGPYGSGKSSILKTFERAYSKYKFLNISLGTFQGGQIKPNTVAEKTEPQTSEGSASAPITHLSCEFNNLLIEKSILQQMLYRVGGDTIPHSRFKRIKNHSCFSYWGRACLAVIWLLAANYTHNINEIFNLMQRGKLKTMPSLQLISIAIVLIGLFYAMVYLFRLVSDFTLERFNLVKGEFDLGKTDDTSILNKHLDEILYFFERTKFDVVVIEDLDRFDDIEIFIKLREINTLINNSENILPKVVFIYAIKDEMFIEKTRTKFFDFIIPVIPVINASNSGEQLLRKLNSQLHESVDQKISATFIRNIALYIDDMRMLHNIVNEFVVYKGLLGTIKLDLEKLLGVIAYKNKYPDDFAMLHENKGMVADFFREKPSFVEQITTQGKIKIDDFEATIEEIDREHITEAKELRRIYLSVIREKIPPAYGLYLDNRHVRGYRKFCV
ncbi:MAG: YobI family P-loop NTPase [Burkholderiales bacterium]